MRLKLIRLTQDSRKVQKLGMLFLFDRFNKLWECCTLEPFENIPKGNYILTKYHSPKLQRKVLLFNIPGFYEIHQGNFSKDTKGCVLVGESFTDLDGDGLRDLTSSVKTLDKLLSLVPEEIKIDIFENPNQ